MDFEAELKLFRAINIMLVELRELNKTLLKINDNISKLNKEEKRPKYEEEEEEKEGEAGEIKFTNQ